MSETKLDNLYNQVREALAQKDYDRATELLKRILVLDENYKDAPRLLAQIVKIGRQRWYNDLRIWGSVMGIFVIGLLIWLVTKLSIPASFAPTPTIIASPAVTLAPTKITTATPIPLAWKRIYVGQEFTRDSITAIVVDPKDPDVIYVGTENAGIYKSIDGGLSWRPAMQGLSGAWIDSLSIDPEKPRNLLAGIPRGGVYRSTDGADSWEQVTSVPIESGTVRSALMMNPQDSQHLYLAQNDFYESIDGGATWVTVFKDGCPEQFGSLAITPDGGTLLASQWGTNGSCVAGIYDSKDNGRTWNLIGSELSDGPDNILVGIGSNYDHWVASWGRATHQSLDGGVTWVDLSKRWFNGNRCTTLTIDPMASNIVYCGTQRGLYRTLDSGENWDVIPGLQIGDLTALNISDGSQHILAGGAGLNASNDGGLTWFARSNGLGIARFELKSDISDASTLYLGAENPCSLYQSIDQGISWELFGNCGQVFDADGETIYQAGGGTSSLSMDKGEHWIDFSLPLPGCRLAANPFLPGAVFALCGSGPLESAIYFSTDFGESWLAASGGAEKPGQSRLFFAGEYGRLVYEIVGCPYDFRSNDGGQTWETCGSITCSSESDSRLAIHPFNGLHIYRTSRGEGVLESIDGCQSWQHSISGLGSLFINTIAIDPNNPDIVYTGTDGGGYISFNGGETWGLINDGLLGATVVYSIVVDKDSNVYAATPYGIFRLEGK